MQKLMIFEETQVEVIEIHSIVYFNPYHVAKCLGLTDSAVRMAISKMTKNQAKTIKNSDVKDIDIRKLNNRGETFLTESGVYKLAFKSNKPNAEAFTNWIADEVLPAIRKTGKYELPATKQQLTTGNPLLEQSLYHLQESQKYTSQTLVEHEYSIANIEDCLKLNSEDECEQTEQAAFSVTTYFPDMQSIYQDIKVNKYNRFACCQKNKSNEGTMVTKRLMLFRVIDMKKKYLEFKAYESYSVVDYLNIYNIERAEKTVRKGNIADYKIYCRGSYEPVVIQSCKVDS